MRSSTPARPHRRALVTGAATGIGLAVCQALSRQEWHVLATALPGQDSSALHDLQGVEVVEADLRWNSSLQALVDRVRREPVLDAFISSAGIAIPGPLEAIPAEALREQFEVNTFAPVLLARAILPLLRKSRGSLVFVGAGQGRVALPFGGPYAASKAALAALTDALRAETAGSGITVTLFEPGAVRTGILTDSSARALAQLEGMPEAMAGLYRSALLAVLRRSGQAFRQALPVEDVARLITRTLDSPHPPPRRLVGRDALLLAAVADLPARWRARLVRRLMRERKA
ncbi:SDR family NAD(P)-dependent oxidoreductase [Arthrobacter caoxuetaonis]|uniref:SDR family NAD(P)-dependent oxidoreductase n=1 Tax=Arthrobacter caoxuetaonis TaxID=2886935 RepID=UPI001D15536D|nr:SDR family NAD(P)-dependent oxidoreductase [Arthrobacter caoxuetaonis]MCC3283670.1 SDR family NAD(P)-dependent oxidoreductase [Arthrobacter caoxuetaonis]